MAVGLLTMASMAQGAPIEAGDEFWVAGGGSIRGGEFQISPKTPAAFDDFATFCIEVAQTIAVSGGPYTVHALATQTSTGTALSGGAAYLYTQFATGSLDGYTSAKQNALQAAMWMFQGYGTFNISAGVTVASWYAGSADAQAFFALPGATAWQSSGYIGNVLVMQNVDASGAARQDFLTLQPVPEPAVLLLLGAGLMGAAARLRRRT